MDTLITIITNTAFLGIFTLIVGYMFNRGLQKQKNKFDNQLQKQKGDINIEIEKLKTHLQLEFSNEQEKLNQKRNVYINLINTMTVFIGNRVPDQEVGEYKKNFLKAYDVAWLWASDDVLIALSDYMQFKIENNHLFGSPLSSQDAARLQLLEKELFSKCVLAIRKDIGFTDTTLTEEHYKFINF